LLLEIKSQSVHEGKVCFCRNSLLLQEQSAQEGEGRKEERERGEKVRARERRGQTTCMVAEW
jgi:hypothetical protein